MVPLPPGRPCSGDELEHAASDAGLPWSRPRSTLMAYIFKSRGCLIFITLFEKRNGSMQKIGGIISRK